MQTFHPTITFHQRSHETVHGNQFLDKMLAKSENSSTELTPSVTMSIEVTDLKNEQSFAHSWTKTACFNEVFARTDK